MSVERLGKRPRSTRSHITDGPNGLTKNYLNHPRKGHPKPTRTTRETMDGDQ